MSTSKRVKTSKRKGGETSNPTPTRLDHWFPKQADKITYLQFNATKLVCPPKYLDLGWFQREGFQFPALIEAQGLKRFVEMKGTFYPELVKVFYTCAKISGDGIIRTQVNGVAMEITPEVWQQVAGISYVGERRFEEQPEGYSKMDTYRGMLNDPQMRLRLRLSTGPMTSEDRLLHYIITYVLTPRSTNHAQATDDDIQLVYGMKNSIQMNWILIIEEIMLKAKRLISHQFPYAVLISRFIDHFGVNVEDEVVDSTSDINSLIKEKHLNKLGMLKTPYGWQMAGQQIPPAEDVEGGAEEEEEAEAPAQPSYTPFESAMIQKMDALMSLHHEHRAETNSALEDIQSRLENIEYRMVLHGLGDDS